MFIQSMTWSLYSKKLQQYILNPRGVGYFSEDEATKRQMQCVKGSAGNHSTGNQVEWFWLVDPDDGIIVDARYQVFGHTSLIGMMEATSHLLVGKNYDQAKRITPELIEKELEDKPEIPGFPKETYPHLNLVIEALDVAAENCKNIPLSHNYVAPPAPHDIGEVVEGGLAGWDSMTLKERIAVIEKVLDKDVRPYIALDAGGVEVVNLLQGKEVIISYQGSCTSCHSSSGATLAYIQQILKAKVHPTLVVIPDFDVV